MPEDRTPGLRALLGSAGALKVRPWGSEAAIPATVREIAAAADPATRTFLVKADIGLAALQLGQTATVLMPLPPPLYDEPMRVLGFNPARLFTPPFGTPVLSP